MSSEGIKLQLQRHRYIDIPDTSPPLDPGARDLYGQEPRENRPAFVRE